ncbi:hypothetical protein FRC02_006741 [Tulasnella sp. 418]|nr:hypothetical protein FRC02_006741 [Tulasnella sp. 418]
MAQPQDSSCLSDSYLSLSDVAQARLLREHIFPLLKRISLDEDHKEDLRYAVQTALRRQSRFPKASIATRNQELLQLVAALRRNIKLNSQTDAMEEQNELMIEIMHSMLDYANQLWIVGVEFGEQVDSVHDALVLMCSTIADMNDMASCNCVVIALEVSFELKNSDGKVLDTFTGSSVSVLRSLTLHVWRHLLLGLLAQAQNAQDNSIFVAHRLPQILKDIGQTHGSLSGTGTLFRLIHGTLPDSESDLEDEDKTDEYSDIDEDDDEDDDLPPLIDFDNGAAFRNTVLRSVVGEIGDEIKPQDSVVKAKGEDKRKREDSGGGSCDGSGIDEAIADDIDNEYYLRLDQMARLHSLVIKYLIDRFKDVPTLEDYILIVSHLPTIQGTLVAHIATMQHTTTSLSESIRILIHEDNTSMLHKLVSQNDHLAFQIPHTASCSRLLRWSCTTCCPCPSTVTDRPRNPSSHSINQDRVRVPLRWSPGHD